MSKNILVTGGLGYIGSHTVVELTAHGYTPIIIDNLSNSYLSVLEGIEKICGVTPVFYNTDVNDASALDAIFKSHTIDSVIHFAAFKAVGESVQEPLKYYRNNIGGLITLLETMEANKVKNIVFSSSCTVYGEPDYTPVDENTPLKPATSPYGNTKQVGEQILNDNKFTNTISLRYFNPIGAHSTAFLGELPIGIPNNLVPFITQAAAGLREKITVYGNTYNTPDGTCIRDYIHVVDLAKAHVKAIDYIAQNPNNHFEVFNLGTGNGNSVLEVIECFERVNNLKLNYIIGAIREGDVEQVYANCSKANNILGWKAELNLDAMLTSAWQWQLTLN
jgi:UDP-glucose 4-epimerase